MTFRKNNIFTDKAYKYAHMLASTFIATHVPGLCNAVTKHKSI